MIPYVRRDWLRLLASPSGTFVPGVPLRVSAFGLIASVVYAVDEYHTSLHLPVGLHEIAGALIALILAFRTNTGYARFWEGRTLWGAIVNACRNLARLVRRHATQDEAEARLFAAWIVTFAHTTRRSLRSERSLDEVARLLPPDAYAALVAAPHPALHAADELSKRLAQLTARRAIEPLMATVAERQIATLVDCLGGCERILRTPTPLGYILLMQRFIALYLATLPLALIDRLGILTPIITMIVAYPVLMIEGLGNELDEPFGHDPHDLPLTRICATIERDLLGDRITIPSGPIHGTGPRED